MQSGWLSCDSPIGQLGMKVMLKSVGWHSSLNRRRRGEKASGRGVREGSRKWKGDSVASSRWSGTDLGTKREGKGGHEGLDW